MRKRIIDKGWHRRWIADRRASFFAGKRCAKCGSIDRLEIDHIDPATKVANSIWSWTETRRTAELTKCQVLCHDCHKKKTAQESAERMRGKANTACRKLDDAEVSEIRRLSSAGWTERELGARFGVGKSTIHTIRTGETYKQPVEHVENQRPAA